MRHPIRPFITEYKNRSSKSQASSKWSILQPEAVAPTPPSVDVSAFGSPSKDRDEGCLAAWQAADAIFGAKPNEAVALPTPSPAPGGRILPSLVQEEAPVAAEPNKAPKHPRRLRAASKVTKTQPVEPSKPAPRSTPEITVASLEQPAMELASDASLGATPRRERSPIQRRWVRKTEFRSGEKWKRRLYEITR
jgi:hypothetical protein